MTSFLDKTNQFFEALHQKDAEKLHQYYIQNDYNIPEYALHNIYIRNISSQNIPFLNILQQGKQWKYIINMNSVFINESISHIFNCPILLTYFFKDMEKIGISPLANISILDGFLTIHNEEVMAKLFELKLVDSVLTSSNFIFRNEKLFCYALKHGHTKITYNELSKLYMDKAFEYSSETLDYFSSLYPELKQLTFQQIVNKKLESETPYKINFTLNKNSLNKIFKNDYDKFSYILKNHPINLDDLTFILEKIVSFSPEYDHVVLFLLKYTKEHQPALLNTLLDPKTFNKIWKLDNTYDSIILNFKLEQDLNYNKTITKQPKL